MTPLSGVLRSWMEQIHVHALLISLICDVLINVLYFACMMASFVLDVTLDFNLMEKSRYLARISLYYTVRQCYWKMPERSLFPNVYG